MNLAGSGSLKSVVLNRFRILYPEEPSHHNKAVIEGPKRLMHQRLNDFYFQRTCHRRFTYIKKLGRCLSVIVGGLLILLLAVLASNVTISRRERTATLLAHSYEVMNVPINTKIAWRWDCCFI
jgi:hypothetical protein